MTVSYIHFVYEVSACALMMIIVSNFMFVASVLKAMYLNEPTLPLLVIVYNKLIHEISLKKHVGLTNLSGRPLVIFAQKSPLHGIA